MVHPCILEMKQHEVIFFVAFGGGTDQDWRGWCLLRRRGEDHVATELEHNHKTWISDNTSSSTPSQRYSYVNGVRTQWLELEERSWCVAEISYRPLKRFQTQNISIPRDPSG